MEKVQLDQIISKLFDKKEETIPWKYGAYKIIVNFKRFFRGKPLKKKEDLNLLGNVETLLSSSSEPSDELIDKCHHFIELHRIIENTSARKRSEKWATRVIVYYLLFVFLILIADGILFCIYDKHPIPGNIMIAILTTTTVNVIGLVLIVLKGYFYTNDIQEIGGRKKKKITEAEIKDL